MVEPVLSVSGLSVLLGSRMVVREARFALTGGFTALIGPNGAGKTSLLRACLGLIARQSGEVALAGLDPARISPSRRARLCAYLPQKRPLAWPLRVRDVVALGRFAFGAAPGRLSRQDAAAVDRAMAACDLTDLAQRRCDALSGGETARVHIARALAAEAPLLLADEPIAALDPRHALAVLALLRGFADRGGTVLASVHDLDLAGLFADRILVMQAGAMVADGAPEDVLRADLLAQVFGVSAAPEMIDGRARVRLAPPKP
ncbi:MAG: ABC transporter ATP-binding protein [Caulobacterales bacterium]|jgi:iron complex transport system ATP-binding protein